MTGKPPSGLPAPRSSVFAPKGTTVARLTRIAYPGRHAPEWWSGSDRSTQRDPIFTLPI
jgi:hypothetical protein